MNINDLKLTPESGKPCEICGRLHSFVCPRIRSIRANKAGYITRVEFWGSKGAFGGDFGKTNTETAVSYSDSRDWGYQDQLDNLDGGS